MSNEEKPKLGAGHLAAMGRQGLAELRAALYPESNVAQPPGPGIYGTSTQREVYEARLGELMEPTIAPPSTIDLQVGPFKDEQPERGREPPEPE